LVWGVGSAGMKGPSVHPTFDKSRQVSLVQRILDLE
jgi:hypothetical protein